MPEQIFKRLVYIYIGTSDYAGDYHYYRNVLGAERLWEFSAEADGARVAAFSLCGEPFLLIADHVHAPSKRLIYEVENLEKASKQLKDRGWEANGGSFEVPDGPCYNFKDKSGNEFAILQMSRPYALQKSFKATD